MMRNTFMQRLARLTLAQGWYFVLTGIWPLVHIDSFMWVTGPKHDVWLVKTVGVLVLVVGAVLLKAGTSKSITGEIKILACGSAGGLMAIDVIYTMAKVISPIYLADAAVEAVLLCLWILLRPKGRDAIRF